eukprot:NODE_8_length_66115_cov_0.981823.p37 type:complete len:201 gc:universal NODE_8_length_66115_cov_0.981823:54236-53634(-)
MHYFVINWHFKTPTSMKITSTFLQRMKIIPSFCVLSAENACAVLDIFNLLDFNNKDGLDDIQFCSFLLECTDLSPDQASHIFDIFDLDKSGMVEFNEFYVLVCIMVATQHSEAQAFLYRHWRTCFELLDEDGGKSVSRQEFITLGYLFGFSNEAVKRIYQEFDVSGNKELDIEEFRLFVFEAMNIQRQLDTEKRHLLILK